MDAEAIRFTAGLGTHSTWLGPSLADELEAVHGDLGDEYRRTFSDDWAQRLYEERLKIPTALGVDAAIAQSSLPSGWRGLSWRVAPAFMLLFRDGLSPSLHRTGGFSPASIAADPAVRDAFDQRGVNDAEGRLEAIRRQYRGIVPDAGLELAGDGPLADAVRTAHLRLATAEIADAVGRAHSPLDAERRPDARHMLDEQLRRYPWNGTLFFARAVVRTREGDLAAARQDLIPALILGPDIGERWRLLQLVLSGLGCPEEAALAASFSTAFG